MMNKINSISLKVKILLIMCFAFIIRLFPISSLFSNGRVVFVGYDSYYHIRLISYIANNFPSYLASDSYINYPYGFDISWPPLFDQTGALLALILGFGNPSVTTIELAAALFPVILGTLSLIPVYYIASKMFDERVGLYSIIILALLPAHTIISMFAAVDHNSAIILLSTTAFALFIFSIKESFVDAQNKSYDISNFLHSKAFLYAAGAGLVLTLSILTWPGSPIFIGLFAIYVPIQIALDIKNNQESKYLIFSSFFMYLFSLVSTLPVVLIMLRKGYEFNAAFVSWFHVVFILLMLVFISVCWVIAYKFRNKINWWQYFSIILSMSVLAVLSLQLLLPSLASNIYGGIKYLFGYDDILSTISEALPLFTDQYGNFTLQPLWGGFGFFFIVALISLIIVFKKEKLYNRPDFCFFVVWSFLFLILAMLQRRFLDFLTINISILSGYFLVHLQSLTVSSKTGTKQIKKHQKDKKDNINNNNILFLLIFGILLLPAAIITGINVSNPDIISNDWQETVDWIEQKTPVTSYYTDPSQISEYSIMSWWDYGNWIIYRGQRPVVTNNFQPGVRDSASFFVSLNESNASSIIESRNSKYIITDLSMLKGKFYNIARLAGENYDSYFDEQSNNSVTNNRLRTENEKFSNTILAKLHVYDGSQSGHYRLVHESSTTVTTNPEVKDVKIFEYVKGATIVGTAQPNEVVYGAVTVLSNKGRKFDYFNSARADANGNYKLLVAYSTDNANSEVNALTPYTVVGKESQSEKKINISDSNVKNGDTLRLDLI